MTGAGAALATGDLGDGTYRNPVLAADWSDPDVVRVGEDYHLTASSFGRAPGLPLLHSRDLVNWTLVGHALERLEPAAAFTEPRHDRGVWAPSFRYHDGRFWIFWGDPDHGIYQVNAPSVRGPWTAPHLVKAGRGLIDACPLWDEESGEAYLVHAWAKSRAGFNNRLTGHRMSPDGTRLLDAGRVLVDADRLPGWFTLEGPKLYRHDGWFWIFAPAGGVATGWQGAFRSRSFFGPYQERIVLAQGDTDVNGPHQGGWVRTGPGEDWFLHFQQSGAHGRLVHLQPMRWAADGWPVLGDEGAPVRVHRKPDLPEQPPARPAVDDTFPGGRFGRQWQWTANPGEGWASQHTGDGLRLDCVRSDRPADLRSVPHVLTQRLPAGAVVVEVGLRLDSVAPGARAGLVVLGDAYAWIGLERAPDGTARLVHRFAPANADRERDASRSRPLTGNRVLLRIEVTADARCRFSYDTGTGFGADTGPDTGPGSDPGADAGSGSEPRPESRPESRSGGGSGSGSGGGPVRLGPEFAATPWRWVGALLGLFAGAPDGAGHAGTAVFSDFRVTAA